MSGCCHALASRRTLAAFDLADLRINGCNNGLCRVECSRGDVLRVVRERDSAVASFAVEGCTHVYLKSCRSFLGTAGRVLEVGAFAVKLQHDDGKELWWGHAALSKALTSADVDRLKVLVRYTTVPPAMKCWSRI